MSDESNALRELKDESKNLVEYLDGMARSIVPAFREKHHAQALHVIALWKVIADAVEKIESLTRERDLALAATDAILDECEATMAIAKTTNDTLTREKAELALSFADVAKESSAMIDTLRAELDAAKVDANCVWRWRTHEHTGPWNMGLPTGLERDSRSYKDWIEYRFTGALHNIESLLNAARSRGETEETK